LVRFFCLLDRQVSGQREKCMKLGVEFLDPVKTCKGQFPAGEFTVAQGLGHLIQREIEQF